MNELSPHAKERLRLAKMEFSPSAAEVQHVRNGVALALSQTVAAISDNPFATPTTGNAATASGSSSAAAPLLKLALPVLSVVAIGGAGLLSGYHLGFDAGAASVAASPAAVSPPRTPSSPPTPSEPAARAPAVTPTVADPHEGNEAPADNAGVSARGIAQQGGAPQGMTPQEEELFQVKRVQRALRDGNGALALALLDDLDRAIPRGRLTEERQAARLMAGCVLGRDVAAARAQFLRRYPTSIYISRINERCGAVDATHPAAPATEPSQPGQE